MKDQSQNDIEKLFIEIAERICDGGEALDPSSLDALCNIISTKQRPYFQLETNLDQTDDDYNKNYTNYEHYCNYHIANVMILDKIKEIFVCKKELIMKLQKVRKNS